MISWGIVTIVTGFVHTATQFYAARFFLGAAESSFFPGMIVYLTHWFVRATAAEQSLAYMQRIPPNSWLT